MSQFQPWIIQYPEILLTLEVTTPYGVVSGTYTLDRVAAYEFLLMPSSSVLDFLTSDSI